MPVPSGTHARLVQPVHVSDDAEITIGTSPRSRKTADITATPSTVFAVEDRAKLAYITVTGRVDVVDDLEARRQRWIPGMEAFFPAGPEGDDFVLLVLHAERIELMSFAEAIHPDPYGLVPAVIERHPGADWNAVDAQRNSTT